MQKIRQVPESNIGRNLRRLRLVSGMTQEQMVAQLQLRGCDVSRSMYSQMESGTYNIRVSELIALKQILRVDFNTLFDGLEDTVSTL